MGKGTLIMEELQNICVCKNCGGNVCVAMQWESPTQEGDTVRVGAFDVKH